MTWFRVDDGLAFHAKAVRAGNSALGLWVRAGAWCGQHLTDGVIPHEIAKTMGKPSEIKALVSVGFWDKIEGDSYRFHDWFQSNPSREEVEGHREREREKKAAWRARKTSTPPGQEGLSTVDNPVDSPGDNPVSSPGESTGESPGESTRESTVSRPDPTRPTKEKKTSSSSSAQTRASSAPNQFKIDDALRAWAEANGVTVDLEVETETFLDHHRAKGSAFKDWRAAWRTWMRNTVKFSKPSNVRSLRAVGPDGRRVWTRQELEDVLGPSSWQLPQPPRDLPEEQHQAWAREQLLAHQADRVAKAEAKIAARGLA